MEVEARAVTLVTDNQAVALDMVNLAEAQVVMEVEARAVALVTDNQAVVLDMVNRAAAPAMANHRTVKPH
jgi:hypothetical protein